MRKKDGRRKSKIYCKNKCKCHNVNVTPHTIHTNKKVKEEIYVCIMGVYQ
jgi:hypothetical protein